MFDFTLLLFDNSLIVEDCYKKGEIEHVFLKNNYHLCSRFRTICANYERNKDTSAAGYRCFR